MTREEFEANRGVLLDEVIYACRARYNTHYIPRTLWDNLSTLPWQKACLLMFLYKLGISPPRI